MLKNAESICIMHLKTSIHQCQRLCMARVVGKKQMPSQPYHEAGARSSMRWRGRCTLYRGSKRSGSISRVLRYHLDGCHLCIACTALLAIIAGDCPSVDGGFGQIPTEKQYQSKEPPLLLVVRVAATVLGTHTLLA
jgi:hypothetical protein